MKRSRPSSPPAKCRKSTTSSRLNLDIERFAKDVIAPRAKGRSSCAPFGTPYMATANAATPESLVLDPTCGSGAFLFAALSTSWNLSTPPAWRVCAVSWTTARGPGVSAALSTLRDIRRILEQVSKQSSEEQVDEHQR